MALPRTTEARTPIAALILDFDGLILDTETPIFEEWRVEFAARGHELGLDEWQHALGTNGGFDPGGRLAELKPDSPVEPVITTSAGTVQHAVAQPNPATGGWRVSFVLTPDKAPHCDLRGVLQLGDEQLSEVWLYRWTP